MPGGPRGRSGKGVHIEAGASSRCPGGVWTDDLAGVPPVRDVYLERRPGSRTSKSLSPFRSRTSRTPWRCSPPHLPRPGLLRLAHPPLLM